MQIKKINNDKLKIILSSNDLSEKNIDIDSFLSNSVESQNLFFEILDLADERAIIPMKGKTESLNASVATAIILYEYIRQANFR